MEKWDKYGRISLDAASAATSVSFSAAKAGTKLGFSIARGIASSAAGLTGSALDHAVFGGTTSAGPIFGGAVSSAISAIETLTMTPLLIGEALTSTMLVAAQSSLSVLQAIFPGSDEASFCLTSFVTLVRREWNEDMQDDASPETRYGVIEIMKALVAWATVQGMTSDWQEKRWFKHLREIHVNDEPETPNPQVVDHNRASRIYVTQDTVDPNRGGQILTADIGEVSHSTDLLEFPLQEDGKNTNVRLKARLRRFSKLALAGYGGASLWFFGVPPIPVPTLSETRAKSDEEANLAAAIGSSEADASGSNTRAGSSSNSTPSAAAYSWLDLLRGKHDRDILLHYAQSEPHSPNIDPTSMEPTVIDTVQGAGVSLIPRFWVLTDHARKEVVLVIRGTMSLNELAVDLTCDPTNFQVHRSSSTAEASIPNEQGELDAFDEELENLPGSFPLDVPTPPSPAATTCHRRPSTCSSLPEIIDIYQVHGGMLKMARAMGNRGKPVHSAVKHALRQNDNYALVICGHSLGGGVAALLALMWADPGTCLTHRASGLPTKRHLSAYCFGAPCLVSARLSRLAAESNLITSFVHSHDIVSRLSLGSIRDLRRATAWLCEAEKARRSDGYGGVTAKALKSKTPFGTDESQWFLSIRKTLEANMHMAHLYPPGRVFWALHESDLSPAQRLPNQKKGVDKLRLFEVQDVEQVFGQIVFAKDMLSSHMPHQYDRVLHNLL